MSGEWPVCRHGVPADPVCVCRHGDSPDCAHHDHVPGRLICRRCALEAAQITSRNGAWLIEWAPDRGRADAADGLEAALIVAMEGAPSAGFAGPFRVAWLGQHVWQVHASARRNRERQHDRQQKQEPEQ